MDKCPHCSADLTGGWLFNTRYDTNRRIGLAPEASYEAAEAWANSLCLGVTVERGRFTKAMPILSGEEPVEVIGWMCPQCTGAWK